MYWDFHCHDAAPELGVIKLVSIPESGWNSVPAAENVLRSLEFHPWRTTETTQIPQSFKALAAANDVAAIGEIGLDRLRGASLPHQSALLGELLELAGELHKPAVLHCVRAHAELLGELTGYRGKAIPAVLLHGFDGGAELLTGLLKHGLYVSLRPRAWTKPELKELFAAEPGLLRRCLVERDEQKFDLPAFYRTLSEKFGADLCEYAKAAAAAVFFPAQRTS